MSYGNIWQWMLPNMVITVTLKNIFFENILIHSLKYNITWDHNLIICFFVNTWDIKGMECISTWLISFKWLYVLLNISLIVKVKWHFGTVISLIILKVNMHLPLSVHSGFIHFSLVGNIHWLLVPWSIILVYHKPFKLTNILTGHLTCRSTEKTTARCMWKNRVHSSLIHIWWSYK